MIPSVPAASFAETSEIELITPYRLDLTVSALRRMATNPVDILTADGRYLRALGSPAEPVVVSVSQPRTDALTVSVGGKSGDIEQALKSLTRILATDRDVSDFERRARGISWLAPLAQRMSGLKPPRYPDLFEACANTIAFQQVSLHAASAIMRRLVVTLGATIEFDGMRLYRFPSVESYLGADDAVIRSAGLSAGKAATLRRVGEAIASGAISEAMLEALPSADAALLLRRIKGIGPWTAAVILLRGLGRLDVFPGNDSSVAANLELVADERVDAGSVLGKMGPQRGMLYFYLLLARLEARGEIGRASEVVA